MTWLFANTQEADKKIVDRVAEVANARGIPRVQGGACLAPGKAGHYRTDRRRHQAPPLDDALASVAVKLTAAEIAALEQPYVPHAVVGFV